MKIVFDASTLILLPKTDLLREVTDEAKIIIPEKVNPVRRSSTLQREGSHGALNPMFAE
jgi:hypothetical protein